MQKLRKIGEIINLFVNNRIVIYGAGDVATLVMSFACSNGIEKRVVSFAVSNINNNIKEIMGVEVRNFTELKCEYDKVLVAVDESIAEEIVSYIKINSVEVDIVCISNDLIKYIRNIEEGTSDRLLQEQSRRIERAITKLVPRPQLFFSVSLCEHCNLNCAGCYAFSPLAKEQYLDIVQYEKDIIRLAELSGGRKSFPKGRISFVTNGLLLQKQSDEFYDKCCKYDIDIDITPYPIGLDYNKMAEFLEQKGIIWKWQNGNEIKKMCKKIYDLNPNNPDQQSVHNWLNCFAANSCTHLRDGKMMCSIISSAANFIDYFPEETKRMYVSKRDSIDIYSVKTIDEIFSFLSRPYPFCKYCKVDDTISGLDWKKSSRDINEWI